MAKRIISIMSCSVCKNRNYYFASVKKKDHKVDIKKYCPKCRKHTLHKESK